MGEAFDYTKGLIKKFIDNDQTKAMAQNPKYVRYYGFTNERIAEYLKAAQIRPNTKALSVLASGDHAFNLVANGIKTIDTFDINNLTEYYVFGLKYALISKCNYFEFMETYKKIYSRNTTPEEIATIIHELLPYMDQKYRMYWKDVLEFYIKAAKDLLEPPNLFEALIINWDKVNKLSPYLERFNAYLASEKKYNQFKANLIKSNITFTYSNATDLALNFKGKYDYILLSNILDYIYKSWGASWDKSQLKIYIKSLATIANNNAIIFLHYCFHPDFGSIVNSNIGEFKPKEIIELKREDCFFHSAEIIKRIRKPLIFKRGKNDECNKTD